MYGSVHISLCFQGVAGLIKVDRYRIIHGGELMSTAASPEKIRSSSKEHPGSPIVERIRRRAEEIWEQRGDRPGSDFDDWLKAKNEVLREVRLGGSSPFRDPPAAKKDAYPASGYERPPERRAKDS
jgi:hypothetical protein